MKKLLVLFVIMCFAAIPAYSDTLNYKIRQNGDTMVIVPYYSTPVETPAIFQESNPSIQSAPVKIPYYSQKLPKGKNRTRSV